MTAQIQLRDLLRDRVAPALRERAFAGSGRDFNKRIGHEWAVINVQRDRYSTVKEVRFTVNLGVACPHVLAEDAMAPDKAPPGVHCHYRVRIGEILPSRRDTWWTVRSRMTPVEADVLGSTIAGHLLDRAIPALERMADHEVIVDSYGAGDRFDGLSPRDMDVIGPILRDIGPATRFAAYLAAIDASPPETTMYAIQFDHRRRLGFAATSKAIQRLGSSQFTPRVEAVMQLSAATPTDDVLRATRPCLDDPSPYIRQAAAETLGRLGDLGSFDRFVAMIEDDPARSTACAAAIAASMLAPLMSDQQRDRARAAIRQRHGRAVGHERPILESLISTFDAPA